MQTSIGDADIVLNSDSETIFVNKKLRWVQSISSGVDSFLYPEFINNDVLLTSEKGLVGEHLADHARQHNPNSTTSRR